MSRPPPSGSIEEHPLALVCGAAAAKRFTGRIRVEHEERAYSLNWRGGAIVSAESPQPDDQLGRICLEAGLIDIATLTESLRRMATSNKRQLDVLVEMGALAGETAQRAARLTLARGATRPFMLTQGAYTAEERHFEWAADELEPRWVIYRGLRLHYDERRLDRELSRLAGKAIKLRPEAEAMQDSFGFADEERILSAYLGKGYWEPLDLVDAAVSLARPVVLAVIYALYVCEALDVQPAESVPRLRKRAREVTNTMTKEIPPLATASSSGSFVRQKPSEIEKPYPDTTPPGSVPLVPNVMGLAAPKPSPAAMAAAAAASAAAALAASAASAGPAPAGATTAPTTSSSTPPPASGAPASRQSQPSISRNPTPPQGPRTSTSGQMPVARPPGDNVVSNALREQILAKSRLVDSGADHFAVLEITRETNKDQIKTTYFHMAKTYHPDRLALVNLEELRPQVERIFARLSEAFNVLGDDARRKEYLTILAEGGEAKVRARESQETAKAVQILSAEEHFRRGEMAFRRQAYQQAHEAFKKALEMNADEGEHHAMHAWTLWCITAEKDRVLAEVKKGLMKALELNQQCAPAFYFLGALYKHLGEIDRAYAHFQRCINLTPGHVDAEREIRLIEMRRERGGNDKKGLFDRFKKK